MKPIFKMTFRTVRTFFGRYMALLLIVALSAGFFAGLKVTTDAMINTGGDYFNEQNFYDFRLFSTLGFSEADRDEFLSLDGVNEAEGGYSVDALIEHKDSDHPFKIYSINDSINLPSLSAGRLPETDNECIVDEDVFTEDDIGKKISLSGGNEKTVAEQLENTEFTIVGLASSPLSIGLDKGTASIGNGTVYSFIYIPKKNFTSEVFTELNITLDESAYIYSNEYEKLIDKHEDKVSALCEELAEKRYDDILAENMLAEEIAEQMGIEKPETYVLTRNENAGYVSFENDTGIIGGVANIFPIFFIMIAILVCITTMTRMVDEERTQIGVLKAMGFSNRAIMGKYLLYAGSATVIGWVIGFFACTWGLPRIFWLAYNEIYGFAPISYLFSPELAVLTLAISLFFILGSTYLSCRKELSDVPAALIRPRAAKTGKRIILEHITPIWKRLSFLQKITVRNMMRYKQRLFMMIVGISCCAGLVVTAFGVRDSMIDVGELQYGAIQKQDLEASFDMGTEDTVTTELDKLSSIEDYLTVSNIRVDISADKSMSGVNLLSLKDTENISKFWDFHIGEEKLTLPKTNEAYISPKVAEKLSIGVGDTIEIRDIQDSDMHIGTVTVAAVFDNHIYDYVVISKETHEAIFEEYETNTVLINAKEDPEVLAKELTELHIFTGVSQLDMIRANISDALDCLNYIIWLIVFFSGALAFIVIFNLTNINLAERSREIATVQVLGFYPKETESYALRENLVLSVIASILGLPLGKLFHTTVMSMVKIDMITFNNVVHPVSYIAAFVCTVLFAFIVNRFMKRNIRKINMAESLKAVE